MSLKRVRPVRRQRRPGYPTRPEVRRDPELLRHHVPAAWKKSAQVTAALSIMLTAACADNGAAQKPSAKVAPLFTHGSGRASSGGVVFIAHKFISEDEARKIITEELQKAGVSPTGQDVEFKEVTVKYGSEAREGRTPLKIDGKSPLKMDLVDPAKGVAVEFVSSQDSSSLGGTMREGTLSTDDIVGVAKALGDKIRTTPNAPAMCYGIFYDPCVVDNAPGAAATPDPNQGKETQEAKNAADAEPQELLRAQVKDFIEWLKGQGVL